MIKLTKKSLVSQPRRIRSESPFEWINAVQLTSLLGPVPTEGCLDGGSWADRLLGKGLPRLDAQGPEALPAGFVPVVYDTHQLLGVTPEDHRVRLRRIKTWQVASLDFWAKALADELVHHCGSLVKTTETLELNTTGATGSVLNTATSINGREWLYDIWLIQDAKDPKTLNVVEYARTATAPPDREAALRNAGAAASW